MEAICILDTYDQIEDAKIATTQAMRRQGLNPDEYVATVIRPKTIWGQTIRYGWLFTTVGMTEDEHVARLNELKELGQFDEPCS